MASDNNSGTVRPMGVDGYGTGKHVDHSRGVAFGGAQGSGGGKHADSSRPAM